MLSIIVLLINFSNAQMSQDQIMTMITAHAQKNSLTQDTVCAQHKKLPARNACLRQQVWLDLNSDTLDANHVHTRPVHATLFKNRDDSSHPCAIEMTIDPIKKTITQSKPKWSCWTPETSAAPAPNAQ